MQQIIHKIQTLQKQKQNTINTKYKIQIYKYTKYKNQIQILKIIYNTKIPEFQNTKIQNMQNKKYRKQKQK